MEENNNVSESKEYEAKWIKDEDPEDGYEHYRCSACGKQALYYPVMEEDYDYDCEDEMYLLGICEAGISEFITDFCPHCGKKMDKREALYHMYRCQACAHYDSNSKITQFSAECENCGDYPWCPDDIASNWKMRDM